MSTFALVDENLVVRDLLEIPDEQAYRGGEYLATDLGLGGLWLEASPQTHQGIYFSPLIGIPHPDQSPALRGNYPEIDVFTYSPDLDAFIPPQPHESWVLNEQNYCWDPPVERPTGSEVYWSDETDEWIEVVKPYPSWTLSTYGSISIWTPPLLPSPGQFDGSTNLAWDEDSLSWVSATLPTI